MHHNYPQRDIPQSNIVQRFFAQPARAILLEVAMTLVITLAAGGALDLWDPFSGEAETSADSVASATTGYEPLLPLRDASWRYLQERRFRAAEAVADVAASADPQNPAGFALRGAINLRSGEYADARRDFRKALTLDLFDFDGHNALCWAEGELGNFTSALRHCDAAIRLAVTSAQKASALENRCWLGVEMADYAGAAKDCLATLELLDGCHSEICALAHYNLGRIALARDEGQAALRHFRLAVRIGSAYARMYLEIGRVYATMGYEVAAEGALARYHALAGADSAAN